MNNELDENRYKKEFLEWRERFFDKEIKILEYKSKSKGTHYSREELERVYQRVMLSSPLNQQP